ncbi:MAG: hypothetical protein ACPGLV_09955 [Bacteroidia bacterium]
MKTTATILLLFGLLGSCSLYAQDLNQNQLSLKKRNNGNEQIIAVGTQLQLFANDSSISMGVLSQVGTDFLIMNGADTITFNQFDFIAILSSKERKIATCYLLGGTASTLAGGYYFINGGLLGSLGQMFSNPEAENLGSRYLLVGAGLIAVGTSALVIKGKNLFKPIKFNLETDWKIVS